MSSAWEISIKAPRPHLLVVDDDARLAELLQRYLEREGYQVSLGMSAEDARDLLEYIHFDVMILDVRMPDEDGIVLTESLRGLGQEVPILLLSAEGKVESRILGLQMGADDYLVKPFDTEELKARIQALLRRASITQGSYDKRLIFGELQYDLAQQTLRRDQKLLSLSGKEQCILGVLANSPHQVLGRGALHEACGGEGSERNIDTLVVRLRKKIEPEPAKPRYLQTIHGQGYVLRPDQILE